MKIFTYMRNIKPFFINNHSEVGIMMIHGLSSTTDEFREMSAFLSKKGFTVYAPLIVGHGTSPEDLFQTTSEDWKKSVKEAYLFLRENTKRIFLVGNSFGSNLGLWLAKEFNNEPIGIITLDAPIFLRKHSGVLFRLYSYGLIQKYYKKPKRHYRSDYMNLMGMVTYSSIPTKSLREFLRFIRKETKPSLKKIKVPALITHSKVDPIVHPKSARYIYKNLGSEFKKIYWFESTKHAYTVAGCRKEVFQKVLSFLSEVIQNDNYSRGIF